MRLLYLAFFFSSSLISHISFAGDYNCVGSPSCRVDCVAASRCSPPCYPHYNHACSTPRQHGGAEVCEGPSFRQNQNTELLVHFRTIDNSASIHLNNRRICNSRLYTHDGTVNFVTDITNHIDRTKSIQELKICIYNTSGGGYNPSRINYNVLVKGTKVSGGNYNSRSSVPTAFKKCKTHKIKL